MLSHATTLDQHNTGLCWISSMTTALAEQVPPLPPVLVAKAADLRMHAHALSAENDFCDTCKMVVVEAASILGNLVSNAAGSPRL